MSYLKKLLLAGIVANICCLSPVYGMEKIPLANFCDVLAGQWRGSASQPQSQSQPKMVSVEAICSADKRQLILSVSEHARYPFSETWWFRDVAPEVSLLYYNGVDEDKYQNFSLYEDSNAFTLLGKGIVLQRPVLIQLRFERQDKGWLWLQNLQYLDEDDDQYRLYRAIAMQPQ
ncbi:hypothetical protein [Shewanella psychrotolerans]|uniref:hypothetical protein n=1 Tax=Shewanella psychrotolerans TaxID=2864206 RepID=UPI0021AC410D|nr:hypothetical protein [Shewanella psychrotolerans]